MKTNFVEVMGKSPVIRILDFLIENDRESWTMVEIRDNAGVGYSTLKYIIPKLKNNNLIKVQKKVGNSELLTINKENPIVKKLYELYNTINEKKLEKFLNN